MLKRSVAGVTFAFLLALTLACTSNATLTPTTPTTTIVSAPDGSTLKASAPVPLSPVNDQQLTSAPVLTIRAATATFSASAAAAFQYRFQVFNASNALVQDSGLVNGTAFQVSATLSPSVRHTWRARAELQGFVGPWSPAASFISAQNVGKASLIAAQEGITLWPGTQPPGTSGHAVMGDNWTPATQYYAPGNVYFQSPTAEMLRLFDLIDRGLDPQSAIGWMNGNGYPTGAQWYPPPEKAVIGIQYAYIACTPVTTYPSCQWDIVVKTE